MAYTVILKPGLIDVVLPNGGRYQGGDAVILTAEQYGVIPAATRLAVIASVTGGPES